ncbi:hypothetical protein SVAN01_09376 [Stagonosporopsis vannaccii]|nr:hypothetical protein SVAN01_09376 [Stagonosporopsis vannaccii]
MTVHKHPIAHHWIRHTLLPFLLYAFASTLPYPADISGEIQRSIDFCLQKADHPSDGDDLVFERIFMAIMHRHKNLAPDLEMVVDHLEPLAKYLIRRAQLKGPYELLERQDVGSAAWMMYEQQRLKKLMFELEDVRKGTLCAEERTRRQPDCVPDRVPPTRLHASPAEAPPAESDIDPRLVHAQQGHFTAASIPVRLTVGEDSYYRYRNREYKEHSLRRQQQQQQANESRTPKYTNISHYDVPGREDAHSPAVHGYAQQPVPQLPTASFTSHQHAGRQTLPNTKWLPQQQYPQTQFALPNTILDGVSTQCPYVPHAVAQAQTAPYQTAQYRPLSHLHAQQPSCQLSAPFYQEFKAYSPPSHLSVPQKTLPRAHNTSAPLDASSTPVQPVMQNTDFAHIRGTDWSLAATQRAREIAASITAQERDILAQRIMKRHQVVSMQSHTSRAGFRRSAVSPTAPLSDAPTRSDSVGVGSSGGVTGGNASASPSLPVGVAFRADQGWSTTVSTAKDKTGADIGIGINTGTSSSNETRSGLPTLEQVRSCYHADPTQPQSYTAALGMAAPGPQRHVDIGDKAVPGHTQEQQRPMLPAMRDKWMP